MEICFGKGRRHGGKGEMLIPSLFLKGFLFWVIESWDFVVKG